MLEQPFQPVFLAIAVVSCVLLIFLVVRSNFDPALAPPMNLNSLGAGDGGPMSPPDGPMPRVVFLDPQ